MREGELPALTSADIDLATKQIVINKPYQRLNGKDIFTPPETKKSKQKVPIPDFLCQELQSYMNTRYMLAPDERLFPATKHFLSHEMDRGYKKTGIKRIRVHDIRHSHSLTIFQSIPYPNEATHMDIHMNQILPADIYLYSDTHTIPLDI